MERDPPPVVTLRLPGGQQFVGVTGDGRVVGWFERRGNRVKCVVRTKEFVPVVRILLGFREAVALLRKADAVSLEYVSSNSAKVEVFSGFDQTIVKGGGS